jgi:outer membrane immunogenic protein
MKLRTVVLSAAAAFSFAAVATSACAGGSLKDDRPFSWTGFYVGGLLSYASGDSKHCDDLTCDKPSVVYPKHEMGGWLGGVTAGYNYQMGRVVAGVEVDWSWGKAEGSSPDTSGFGCLGLCSTSVESIGTVRGRLATRLIDCSLT